jgi:hypothetical protein
MVSLYGAVVMQIATWPRCDNTRSGDGVLTKVFQSLVWPARLRVRYIVQISDSVTTKHLMRYTQGQSM